MITLKISEKLNLNKSQFELDFVDIDIDTDLPLFIDSNLIRKYDSEFNAKLSDTMDSFFTYLLSTLSNGMDEQAKYLCSHLSEINETHLGLSKGISQGKGVGPISAIKIFEGLKSIHYKWRRTHSPCSGSFGRRNQRRPRIINVYLR